MKNQGSIVFKNTECQRNLQPSFLILFIGYNAYFGGVKCKTFIFHGFGIQRVVDAS